jgi:hypothetical protein
LIIWPHNEPVAPSFIDDPTSRPDNIIFLYSMTICGENYENLQLMSRKELGKAGHSNGR